MTQDIVINNEAILNAYRELTPEQQHAAFLYATTLKGGQVDAAHDDLECFNELVELLKYDSDYINTGDIGVDIPITINRRIERLNKKVKEITHVGYARSIISEIRMLKKCREAIQTICGQSM